MKTKIHIFICNDDLLLLEGYCPKTLKSLLSSCRCRVESVSQHYALIYGKRLTFDVSSSSLVRKYKNMLRQLQVTSAYWYCQNFMVYECLDRLSAQMLFRL